MNHADRQGRKKNMTKYVQYLHILKLVQLAVYGLAQGALIGEDTCVSSATDLVSASPSVLVTALLKGVIGPVIL